MAFRNKGVSVGTTATTLYTCPSGYECVLHSIYLSNTHASANISVDIDVNLVKSGSGIKRIGNNLKIPNGTSLIFDKALNLREGDSLIITASTAGSCEAIASYLLTTEDTVAPN